MLPKFHLEREQTTYLHAAEGSTIHIEFHFHSHVELLAVLDGQVEVTINNLQKILQPGEIAVALSYDAHQFCSLVPSRYISIVIPTGMCEEFIAAVGDRKTHSPFLRNDQLFETFCTCFRGIKNSANPISQKGHLYVLLGSVLEYMQLEQRQEPTDPRLFTKLLLYLNDHLSEELSLASIAASMGYNPSYLSRAFKGNFHISITQYISMLRLRHAVLLMHDPAKSITDCAFESGFRSLRTFYRAFSKEFHCSPKEYQQKVI